MSAAALLGAAALLLLVLLRGGRDAAPSPPPAPAAKPAAARAPVAPTLEIPEVASGAPGLARDESRPAGLWMLADPTLPRNAADYLVANRFPPQSRPLSPDQTDLLEPNRRYEQERGVQHRDGSVSEVDYRILFTGDRFMLIGDDRANALLQVRRDGEPVDVEIRSARLVPRGAPALAAEVAFAERDGRLYVAPVAPAETPMAAYEGGIELQVEFDYGGPKPGYAELDFRYQPRAQAPARFTGAFREQLEDGSLVIYAGVDVTEPGYYVLDLNLFDAADQPFAWVRHKAHLPAGQAEARFVVYGLLFHENPPSMPLSARNLRGYLVIDVDPGERHLTPYPGQHVTGRYELDQLTDEEYWSQDKEDYVRRQLANIDRTGIPKRPPISDGDWKPTWTR